MRKTIENCMLRNKRTQVIKEQGMESVIKNINNYRYTLAPLPLHKRVQLLFNSLGYSYDRANFYHLLLVVNKLAVITTKNFNSFWCGRGELGKSFLLFNVLGFEEYKLSEEPSIADLRGHKKISNDTDEQIPLLSRQHLIFEEKLKNLSSKTIDILKDTLESLIFRDGSDKMSSVKASVSLVGNVPSDIKISSMNDLNFENLLSNFCKAWTSDAEAMERIDSIFPHFNELLGIFKHERNFFNGEILSTVDLKDSLMLLQGIDVKIPENFLSDLGSREKFSIEKLASSMIKILFIDRLNNLEDFEYEGIIEVAKHFHWLGNIDKDPYNLFTKKSVKFLCSLATSTNNIEFAQILSNRLIVKKEGENFLRKYALNGFGIRTNEQEEEFAKNSDTAFPIIQIKNKGWLLKQEVKEGFKYRPFNALYFNNYKKPNISEEAKDNEIIFKLFEVATRTRNISYLDNIEFKGIPYHIELRIKKHFEKLGLSIPSSLNIRDLIAIDAQGEFKLVNIN